MVYFRHLAVVGFLALLGCVNGDGAGVPGEPSELASGPGGTSWLALPLPEHPAAERHRGVSWVAGPRPVTEDDFATLVDARVSWIVQTPFGWQEDERSPEVRLITSGRVFWGETDEGLEITTRLAQDHSIRTLLKPHIWLSDAHEGAWRGDIAMESEADWRRWFEGYRRLVLHYAALAERLGMPAYCVGVELHAAARERPEDWRRLIADVREVYSGKLTYAANWYREVEEVPFWSDLDYIGVQAYFPLATDQPAEPGTEPVPTVEDLVAAWEPHATQLEALARRHGRPVLFTEIGYVSRPGATAEPWVWPEGRGLQESSPEGLELQARAYEAFFRTFWHRSWVAGVYFWKWYPGVPPGKTMGVEYSPQGKPAEKVLRRWYGGGE